MDKEAVIGALLGLAIGDALGFPFEGWPREVLKNIDLSRFHPGQYPPGTWSDDTSLSFLTVESLLAKGGLDLGDLAWRFRRWLKEGYLTPFGEAIGVGRATREAILRLETGSQPEDAGGRGERDNGNGALMRLLPVILWYLREDSKAFLSFLERAASLTHAHPRNLIACGLFGLLVRHLVAGRPFKEALFRSLTEARLAYQQASFDAQWPHFERLQRVYQLKEEEIRASGYVVHTLEAVCFLLSKELPFPLAVEKAVRLGGDTDTTAALVGGVTGLLQGQEALPSPLLRGLVKVDELFTRAEAFAERLIAENV